MEKTSAKTNRAVPGLFKFFASFILFVKAARLELRKVTWPSRQETVQVTFVVSLMVLVIALVLWGIDGFLLKIMAWLTGTGV